MKRVRRVTYFLAAFIFATCVPLALMQHAGLFEVSGVPVELVSPTSDESHVVTVTDLRLKERLEAALKSLKGKRIWEIDLTDVRASIARDEWVRDVLISRSLPNGVRVRVRPKEAALVLVNKKGEFVPVTEDGDLLSALPNGVLPDVPLLRGETFLNDAAKRDVAVKFAMAMTAPGPLNRRNISDISWSSEDGYAITLIQPKVEVKLGEDRVELKAARVGQVLSYLSVNNLKGKIIDASFSKKVLVRLRKGP